MTAPMTKSLKNSPDTRPAYLIFEFERRAYPIGTEAFMVGRASSCDIVIREPAVSRIHAELIRTPDGIVMKPFGATPTIVNGLAAPGETLLRHGDVVDIGSARLTFNETSLPLGVSIVDKSRARPRSEEVDNRRPTITNPILGGRADPNEGPAKKLLKPAILFGVLAVIAAYYFGVLLR